MSPERLLHYFERISEAPDAIPRLRRFILDLAVRGKLVPQNPDDEPAEVLLKRLNRSRAQVGKRSRDVPTDGDVVDRSKFPSTWVTVPLLTLGPWAVGSGFPKNEQGHRDGPHFFLKVSDMNLPGNEKHIVSAQNTIDEAAVKRMRARLHPPGTIIFPKIGGAIATNKRRILTRPSAIDNNCLGITCLPELCIDWCYLLLCSLDFTVYQAGTAVPALQQGTLGQIAIGLPPLAEQHRIVAKVDELMALCDELEAAQAKREDRRARLVAATLHGLNNGDTEPGTDTALDFTQSARFYLNHLPRLTTRPEHVHQLRQTILNLAVRGKLVPQNPEDEPARLLTHRIEKRKRELAESGHIPKNRKTASTIEDIPLPSLPWSWEWVPIRGITVDRGQKVPNSDFTYIDVSAIDKEKGRIHTPQILSADAAPSRARKIIRTGDVIYSCVRPYLLNIAVVDEDFEPEPIASTAFAVLYGLDLVNPQYLWIVLRSSHFVNCVEAKMRGQAYPAINDRDFALLPVPLPPLAEQHRIVAKVDELMALCDELEAQLTSAATTRARLLEATLHEALNGTGDTAEAAMAD